jgi:hypothetical protein
MHVQRLTTLHGEGFAGLDDAGDLKMPESKIDFRRALGSVIEARGREATRRIARSHEHQLLGAFTKRPN